MAKKGGKRPGAGRKKGSITKKSREVAERVVVDGGISMLDIMVDNARYFHRQATDAETVLGAVAAENLQALEPKQQFDHMLAEVKKAASLRTLAGEQAKNAAPFLHCRLAAIEHTGKDGGPIEVTAVASIIVDPREDG